MQDMSGFLIGPAILASNRGSNSRSCLSVQLLLFAAVLVCAIQNGVRQPLLVAYGPALPPSQYIWSVAMSNLGVRTLPQASRAPTTTVLTSNPYNSSRGDYQTKLIRQFTPAHLALHYPTSHKHLTSTVTADWL